MAIVYMKAYCYNNLTFLSLTSGLESLQFILRGSLEGTGADVRDQILRNSVTMSLYLTTEYIDLLEGISTKPTTDQIVAGKKKV